MKARLNDGGSVISAFALPARPGRIYVEGPDPSKIWQACSIVPEICKCMVPVASADDGYIFDVGGVTLMNAHT
jgi:hypothetical protein